MNVIFTFSNSPFQLTPFKNEEAFLVPEVRKKVFEIFVISFRREIQTSFKRSLYKFINLGFGSFFGGVYRELLPILRVGL